MGSKYVRQEWEYALSLGREKFVRPTYWEDPLPTSNDQSLPPDALRRLHFSRLMGALHTASEPTGAAAAVAPPPKAPFRACRAAAGGSAAVKGNTPSTTRVSGRGVLAGSIDSGRGWRGRNRGLRRQHLGI